MYRIARIRLLALVHTDEESHQVLARPEYLFGARANLRLQEKGPQRGGSGKIQRD